MKKISFLLLLFFILACAKKGSEYLLPSEMHPNTRNSFITYLDKGKGLYKDFCSECHGINTAGKDKIPNFTNAQLDMYQAKLSMQSSTSHGMVDSLSYEEVEAILNFLRYRKQH
ncbi:MAG: hypothetical protein IPM92_05420 [Saprospiraceae bacterium]|nr:hypothetical protein [Saprospiraceae bacterium]